MHTKELKPFARLPTSYETAITPTSVARGFLLRLIARITAPFRRLARLLRFDRVKVELTQEEVMDDINNGSS